MRLARSVFPALAFTLLTIAPAAAQSGAGRVQIGVNGLYQATTNDFGDRFTFEQYLETGSTEVDYPVGGGPAFDVGAAVRLWRGLGAGVGFSSFTRDETAPTVSQVPHPFFFEQPREVVGDATGITRTESVVHVQAVYVIDPRGPWRVVVGAGPSFFNVEQDLVTQVRFSESFPFDTATFTTADQQRVTASATGFNVSGDVSWMFSRNFGVGALVRFSRVSVDLEAPGDRTIPVDVGGAQAGGGIRIVF